MSCRMGIVGIGGFGKVHVDVIERLQKAGRIQCVAFSQPTLNGSEETCQRLMENGAKYYPAYEDMAEAHPEMDFVAVVTPIPLHKRMAIDLMERGFHVLLEKPPAVTIQDIDEIIAAGHRTNKRCAVNFQNTTGEAFRFLIEKIKEGILGEIKKVTGVGLWHRDLHYYERNDWAGKLTWNGKYVLDGTLSNPFAHLLHNCLVLAGEGDARNATPHSVQGELYKGHEIQGDDTSCVRMITEKGVEVQTFATLLHERNDTPYILIQGSKGSAIWTYDNKLKLNDGQNDFIFEYEARNTPQLVPILYENFIQAITGGIEPLLTPIDACRNFVLTLNGIYESSKETHKIAAAHLYCFEEKGSKKVLLKEAKSLIEHSVQYGKLFSEIPTEWSVKTSPFNFHNYNHFNL